MNFKKLITNIINGYYDGMINTKISGKEKVTIIIQDGIIWKKYFLKDESGYDADWNLFSLNQFMSEDDIIWLVTNEKVFDTHTFPEENWAIEEYKRKISYQIDEFM